MFYSINCNPTLANCLQQICTLSKHEKVCSLFYWLVLYLKGSPSTAFKGHKKSCLGSLRDPWTYPELFFKFSWIFTFFWHIGGGGGDGNRGSNTRKSTNCWSTVTLKSLSMLATMIETPLNAAPITPASKWMIMKTSGPISHRATWRAYYYKGRTKKRKISLKRGSFRKKR